MQTFPGSLSSSSSSPDNTAPVELTQSPPLSPYVTYSSLSETNHTNLPQPPLPPTPPPPPLASSLQHIKMASKDNLSDTAQQGTPVHVQWQPSGDVWHTYNSTAPPQTRILQRLSKEINGQRSAVQKPSQYSVLQPQSSDPKWSSHQTMSVHIILTLG